MSSPRPDIPRGDWGALQGCAHRSTRLEETPQNQGEKARRRGSPHVQRPGFENPNPSSAPFGGHDKPSVCRVKLRGGICLDRTSLFGTQNKSPWRFFGLPRSRSLHVLIGHFAQTHIGQCLFPPQWVVAGSRGRQELLPILLQLSNLGLRVTQTDTHSRLEVGGPVWKLPDYTENR